MKDRMFISKTPLRITFVGGGSDIKEYYSQYGRGSVLSATINKFIYIVVNKKFDSKIRISYSKTEIVDSVDKIEHPAVKEALKLLDIDGGVEIVSISDIPSGGTGLGSSSTFLVGLLNALHAWKGEYVSPGELAKEAVKIEREILREPGGKQDQYMAAYGGMQQLDFLADEKVVVKPIISRTETIREFEKSLLLLYTGIQRSSTGIHQKQSETVAEKFEHYKKMVEMTDKAYICLNNGNFKSIGKMINENWLLKRQLSEGVSNPKIDQWYDIAIKSGAIGGKIIGAGGGGFMLFMAEPSKHKLIMKNLPDMKKQEFGFESEGSRIIYVGD
ncbi:MAG: GHMP family kinase ATP-binding protein [Thermoplasmataceae archaeon]